MEKEVCNIICIEKDQEKNAVIELTENEDIVIIKFSVGELVLIKEGDNYFVFHGSFLNSKKEGKNSFYYTAKSEEIFI